MASVPVRSGSPRKPTISAVKNSANNQRLPKGREKPHAADGRHRLQIWKWKLPVSDRRAKTPSGFRAQKQHELRRQ